MTSHMTYPAYRMTTDDHQWNDHTSTQPSSQFWRYEIPRLDHEQRFAAHRTNEPYESYCGIDVCDSSPGHPIAVRDMLQDQWYIPPDGMCWQTDMDVFALASSSSGTADPFDAYSVSTSPSMHENEPCSRPNHFCAPDKARLRPADTEVCHGRTSWSPAANEYFLSSLDKHISTQLDADHEIAQLANSTQPATSSTVPSPTHRSPTSKTYWSPSEDKTLLAAVASVKKTFDAPLPWVLVADAMDGRSAVMCSKRYRQLSRHRNDPDAQTYTRGPWTPEEDADLLAVVADCKALSRIPGLPLPWTKIGSMLKQPRSGLQVCARYTEALDETVKRGRWTKEEDSKLLEEYLRLAGRWSLISQEIEGRTQRQCASRYGVLVGKSRTRSKCIEKQSVQCV